MQIRERKEQLDELIQTLMVLRSEDDLVLRERVKKEIAKILFEGGTDVTGK